MLDFDAIESLMPDGSYGDEEGRGVLVSAQWLHDFAHAIERHLKDPCWKDRLRTDLTDAFISYQYEADNPFPTEAQEKMVLQYMTDSIFHAKVDSLVIGVMIIIGRHIK